MDLEMHCEILKYLYSAICRLDVQITEVYGSRDVGKKFFENKFHEWRLICEFQEMYSVLLLKRR